MPMDIPLNQPSEILSGYNQQNAKGRSLLGDRTLNSALIAQHKAERLKHKTTLDAIRSQDGMDTPGSGKTNLISASSKSKLTDNPHAPSPEALRRVMTHASADVVLPPPNADVVAISSAGLKAFVKRRMMHTPPSAGPTGTGALLATSAEQVRNILSSDAPETLTPEEAKYVKQLVGKTPPISTFAITPIPAAAPASTAAAAPATGGGPADTSGYTDGVKSSDSLQHIQQAATTYVPWQAFFIRLSAKQQKVMAMWLLQRQKLQLYCASITIAMLEASKTLQVNTINMSRTMATLAVINAVEQLKNSKTTGLLRSLTGSGMSVMRSATDLEAGVNQNEDRAPVQDLHRMAFLDRVMNTHDAAATHAFDLYTKDHKDFTGVAQQKTASLSVPASVHDVGRSVPIQRSLLSDDEVKALPEHLQMQYQSAYTDMQAQRGNDLGSIVGLYAHEISICRAAAQRWQEIATLNATSHPDRAASARAHAATWTSRGDSLKLQGSKWQQALEHRAQELMVDENRYGDIMRERRNLNSKRNQITQQLESTTPPVDALQRQHLERVRMNIDWRAIALDTELGRYSNPKEDNRLRRWHTGARSIADGFYLAHIERSAGANANTPNPSLRWNTLTSIAPKGATELSHAYIRVIEALHSGTAPQDLPAQVFGSKSFSTIDRTQMISHLKDRQRALDAFPDSRDAKITDPRLARFHQQEREHYAAAEQFFRSTSLFAQKAQPKGVMPAALSFNALKTAATPRWAARSPDTFKGPTQHDHLEPDTDLISQGQVLDPSKAARFYQDKASAGADVMGVSNDPREVKDAPYQNKLFEDLNVFANTAQYINFDAVSQAADESAEGNTQDIIGETCARLSELYNEMNQDQRMAFSVALQYIEGALKVST